MTDVLTLGNSGNAHVRLGRYKIPAGGSVVIADLDALAIAELLERHKLALKYVGDCGADHCGIWFDIRSAG
jgi:hypothetical protein